MARNYDGGDLGETDYGSRSMAKLGDRVHAVIFVIQANDERLKSGTYLGRMKKIRDHFRFDGYSPITVITCEDHIKNQEDREIAFGKASAATGSPIDRTYFITNYTSKNIDYSLQTEKQALEILDTALLSAERYVKIQKLREAHHGSAKSTTASATNKSVKQFFKVLQSKCSWTDDRIAAILEYLDEQQITTVDVLKESWDDIKKEITMTIGIKNGVEKALKNIK